MGGEEFFQFHHPPGLERVSRFTHTCLREKRVSLPGPCTGFEIRHDSHQSRVGAFLMVQLIFQLQSCKPNVTPWSVESSPSESYYLLNFHLRDLCMSLGTLWPCAGTQQCLQIKIDHVGSHLHKLLVCVCAGVCVCVHACTLSHSVMFDSLWSRGLWPARLLCPWDFPAKLLGWVATSSFRGSPSPKIEPTSPVLAGRFFIAEPLRKHTNCLKVINSWH